jgi:hypothetical protein
MRAVIGGLILFATVAQAQDLAPPSVAFKPPAAGPVVGPGNLPPDFYPKSPCSKPDAASIGDKPRDARDLKAVQEYNQRVQAYNKVANAFNPCVTDYAAKARNDIERIQQAIRDANAR